MNMPFWLRSLIPLRWQRTDKSEPISMVMLLREAHFFHANELRSAAERAWHTSFSHEDKESKHCVVQKGSVTLVKAGPHLLNFFYCAAPYSDDPKSNTGWLPQASQREAWAQHAAYCSVDFMNDGVSVQLGYCVLAQLVSEMLDGNCTGAYIPRERSLIPNDQSLYLALHRFASACDSGVNSTDVSAR
jgi:hypothetical protein